MFWTFQWTIGPSWDVPDSFTVQHPSLKFESPLPTLSTPLNKRIFGFPGSTKIRCPKLLLHGNHSKTPCFFLYGAFNVQQQNQLVVEPTHSKNMRTSNWIISPGIRGENSKHIGNHHLAGAIYQPQLVNKPDYLNHQPPAPPHLFIHLEKSAKKKQGNFRLTWSHPALKVWSWHLRKARQAPPSEG